MRFYPVLLVVLIGLISFSKAQEDHFSYDLRSPITQLVLPGILHEISGITYVDSTSIACVQDENGIIFIYDLRENRITKEIMFGFDGDYEGISRVGSTMYVLRSDGIIYEVPHYTTGKHTTIYHVTNIPMENNEGLCYDSKRARLLIGSKNKPSGPNRDKRLIFAFDLKTKKLDQKPAFVFDTQALTKMAIEKNLELPVRENKKGRAVVSPIRLNTSEIAIHPVNGLLYVLSANDHILLVSDMQGNVKHLELLDPVVFNKAEGLAFMENGDMVITNEGQDKKPTLLRFRYLPGSAKKK